MRKRLVTLLATVMVASIAAMAPAATVAKDKPKDACKGGTTIGANGQPLTKSECKEAAKAGETVSGIIAVAWTDLNGNAGYQPASSDVLIAILADDDGTPGLSVGDHIFMGQFPTTFDPSGPADFGAWGVTTHTVSGVATNTPTHVRVTSGSTGEAHSFQTGPVYDAYSEQNGCCDSFVRDNLDGTRPDRIITNWNQIRRDYSGFTPSRPQVTVEDDLQPGGSDDPFIEVAIY